MNSLKIGYKSIGVCAYGFGFPPPPPSTHHQIPIFVKMVKLLDALKHLFRSYKYFRKLIYLFIFVQKLFVFKVRVCGTLRPTCMYCIRIGYQFCVIKAVFEVFLNHP